jgi:hypothetical protein
VIGIEIRISERHRMKEINTASTALLIAERELVKDLDRLTDYPKVCTGEMYGSLAESVKIIATTNSIEIAKAPDCYHCGNVIDEPYMDAKVFCCKEHLEEYQTEEMNNENGMQAIMLDDREAAQQNVMMRIALHKLQGLHMGHEASAVVNEVLIGLARDYGVA